MKNNPALDQKPLFRHPAIFNQFNALITAESTRHGGVSTGAYSSLNLGGSTLDDPENVAENNRRFFTALHVLPDRVAKSHQVHGAEVLLVHQPGRYEGFDALITNKSGIQLAIVIADCTPILIYDPVKQCVAAIHAGWRGTVLKIVSKTVQMLHSEFGTNPADCYAYVGTCIDACSFEVSKDVADQFDSTYKRPHTAPGKFLVDLKSANRDLLISSGIKESNIEISPYSTVLNNEDYFSYRLENGLTGRLIATIGLKAEQL